MIEGYINWTILINYDKREKNIQTSSKEPTVFCSLKLKTTGKQSSKGRHHLLDTN